MSGAMPSMFDLRTAMGQSAAQSAQPQGDWTDRVMQQWQRYPPNPLGMGDFPNAMQAGQASRNLLTGANPREVINPDAALPAAGAQRVQAQMPQQGFLPGQVSLDPSIAPKVPDGAPRPFAPGEFVRNPDGGWSSEMTVTVTNPDMNGGKATVLPALWLLNGRPQAVDENTAVAYARASGLAFPGFDSIDAAEAFANQREATWQSLPDPTAARTVPPLWTTDTSAPR